MSRIHAHRMISAGDFIGRLKTLPRGNVLPQTEAQVRLLLRLPDSGQHVGPLREGDRVKSWEQVERLLTELEALV